MVFLVGLTIFSLMNISYMDFSKAKLIPCKVEENEVFSNFYGRLKHINDYL